MVTQIDGYRERAAARIELGETSNSIHLMMNEAVGSDKHVLLIGWSTATLASVLGYSGCRVTAVDGDPEVADSVQLFCDRVIAEDPETIDFERALGHDRFDVIAVDGLERLEDPQPFLLRIRRYLRSGGQLVTSFPNAADVRVRLALLSGHLPEQLTTAGSSQRQFFREPVERMLAEAGLQVQRVDRHELTVEQARVTYDSRLISEGLFEALTQEPEALTDRFLVVAEAQASIAEIDFVEHRVRKVADDQKALWESLAEVRRSVTQHGTDLQRATQRVLDTQNGDAAFRGRLLASFSDVAGADDALQTVVSQLQEHRDQLYSTYAQALKGDPKKWAQYQQIVHRIRGIVRASVRAGSVIAVVSRGDDQLVKFDECGGWHFPQAANGQYAGYYPANSGQAIAHLEALHRKGAAYILFPATSLWWLEHYTDLADYLDRRCRLVARVDDTCVLYALPTR